MDVDSALAKDILFDKEVEPSKVDMLDAGIKKVLDVFEAQVQEGLHYGAQLVVLRYGKIVLNRSIGLANVSRGLKTTSETPFHCFSITKPFTGMCIHKLIEEGKVELDAPVAKYWPEFGCKGKETATIRHVFLHQAGIPFRGIYQQIPLWVNWGLVTHNVANLKAEFIPGTKTSYHMVNYGFIFGEVLRRVTGRTIKRYLQEEIFNPLNLRNTYLGLPSNKLKESSYIYSGDPEQSSLVFLFNLPFIRSAVIPAATLNSTAMDLAVFFQMLLNEGNYANKTYFKPETITNAVSLGYEGHDENIGVDMRWAYGFHLGGLRRPMDPPGSGMGYKSSLSTFGHFGQNSSMVWADSRYKLVVSFTTNRLLSGEKNTERFQAISDSVWNAVAD